MPRSAMRRSSLPSAALSARIRPAAGSSSSSTCGRVASARAISTRRRSTCGRSPAGVVERAVIADEGEQRFGGLRGRRCGASAASGLPSRPRRSATSTLSMHAHRAEQLRGLVGAGDAGAGDAPGRRAGELGAAEPDAAGVGAVEAADHVEHGGLAGAVRADHAGDAAGLGGKADVGRGAGCRRRRCRCRDTSSACARRRRRGTRRDRSRRAGGGAVDRGAAEARERADACPRGASHSTTSSSAPKNSSRYSARCDSSSGSTTVTAAPTTGPNTQPAPPTITASRNRIDCENGNESGATNIISGAKIAPASPANTADSANAAVLIVTGLRPIERAAVSLSRTATMALPQALRGKPVEQIERERRRAGSPASPSRARRSHARRAPAARGPSGRSAPPVRSCHSIGAVLDDEGERDGDHREIRPGHAQRRQRQQRADRAGDQRRPAETRARSSRPSRSGSRPCRRRWRRSRHGRARPGRSSPSRTLSPTPTTVVSATSARMKCV